MAVCQRYLPSVKGWQCGTWLYMSTRRGAAVVLAASWNSSGSRHRERLGTLHGGEALGSIVMLQPGSGQREEQSYGWQHVCLVNLTPDPRSRHPTLKVGVARARLATASPTGTPVDRQTSTPPTSLPFPQTAPRRSTRTNRPTDCSHGKGAQEAREHSSAR
jgi:hypothetical protein